MRVAGTTPEGVQGEEQAARWVRDMFSGVAGRYDLLNHLLSLNIDKYWRSRTVRRVEPILRRPDSHVLDICCGTGDLLIELEKKAGRRLYGSDFCHPMLTTASGKIQRRSFHSVLFESDALRMPVADASLDLITVAFGVRNFANYRKGFEEMRRVLKPGGAAYIATNGDRHLAELYDLHYRFDPSIDFGWGKRAHELFSIDTGSAELRPWFPSIEVRRYDDALIVTEVAPLVDYILSMATLEVAAQCRADLTAFIEQAMQASGSIFITKDSGVFIAR